MDTPVKFVELGGRRIAYREAGRGPPLLFLHGLGGNSASWQPQFDAFSNSHRLVAWDMPGFGASEMATPSAATTGDFSAHALQLMDALDIEKATGIGTSYGTIILADLVQAHPQRIGAMVFACGVTGLAHLAPPERARLRSVRRAELESMGQRKFAEMRNSTYVAQGMPEAVIKRIVDLAASAQTEGYLAAYGALTESDIFPSLAKIDVPALVIAAANDPIAPARDCERVARALRRAEYHCIDNAGHYVNIEQADTFNRLLAEFLGRVE